jgi:hypothetical protein
VTPEGLVVQARALSASPFLIYLEQRGADFIIAVKHSLHKGFQVIKDRLIYGRKAMLQASKRELKQGRDIT